MNKAEAEHAFRAKGFLRSPDGTWVKAVRIRTVPDGRDTGQASKLERRSGDGTLGAVQVQGPHPGRFLVRLTSYRSNLLDEDNLCEKFHVDCCRYAGLLPGDSPRTTKIEVCQEKVAKGEPEFVRVEIFREAPGPVLAENEKPPGLGEPEG